MDGHGIKPKPRKDATHSEGHRTRGRSPSAVVKLLRRWRRVLRRDRGRGRWLAGSARALGLSHAGLKKIVEREL